MGKDASICPLRVMCDVGLLGDLVWQTDLRVGIMRLTKIHAEAGCGCVGVPNGALYNVLVAEMHSSFS